MVQAHRRAETQASVPRAMRAAEATGSHGFGDLDIGFPPSVTGKVPPPSIEFEDEPGSASFAAVLADAAPAARGRPIAFAPPPASEGRVDDEIQEVFGTPTFKTRVDAPPPTERVGRGAPRMRRSEPPDVPSPTTATRALDELTASKHRMPLVPGEGAPPTVRAGKRPSTPPPPPPTKREPRSDGRLEARGDASVAAPRNERNERIEKGVARRDSGRDGRSAFAAVDEVVANLKKDPRSE